MTHDDSEMTYSEAAAELEQLVARMQDDNCDIDKLAGYTARAVALLKLCREKLFKTDEELKKALEELG